ncbi:hypothetical protein ABBQ32_012397 [Trebouxia sp. C0010 RCD-2024]
MHFISELVVVMVKGTTASKKWCYTDVIVSREDGPPAYMCLVTMHPGRTGCLLRGQLIADSQEAMGVCPSPKIFHRT